MSYPLAGFDRAETYYDNLMPAWFNDHDLVEDDEDGVSEPERPFDLGEDGCALGAVRQHRSIPRGRLVPSASPEGTDPMVAPLQPASATRHRSGS
jgi:hypothetical protein